MFSCLILAISQWREQSQAELVALQTRHSINTQGC